MSKKQHKYKDSMYSGPEVDCIFKDKCTDYPERCDSCSHNNNNKRSYYSPDYYPWWPIVTWSWHD